MRSWGWGGRGGGCPAAPTGCSHLTFNLWEEAAQDFSHTCLPNRSPSGPLLITTPWLRLRAAAQMKGLPNIGNKRKFFCHCWIGISKARFPQPVWIFRGGTSCSGPLALGLGQASAGETIEPSGGTVVLPAPMQRWVPGGRTCKTRSAGATLSSAAGLVAI